MEDLPKIEDLVAVHRGHFLEEPLYTYYPSQDNFFYYLISESGITSAFVRNERVESVIFSVNHGINYCRGCDRELDVSDRSGKAIVEKISEFSGGERGEGWQHFIVHIH